MFLFELRIPGLECKPLTEAIRNDDFSTTSVIYYSSFKLSSHKKQKAYAIVQYCIDNDMYVIVNIHWDGGWLENNVTPEKQAANTKSIRTSCSCLNNLFRQLKEGFVRWMGKVE